MVRLARCLFTAWVLLGMTCAATYAFPAYEKKEGKPCIYCHVKTSGGPRNYRGLYYKVNRYSFARFDDAAEAKKAGAQIGPAATPPPRSFVPPVEATGRATAAVSESAAPMVDILSPNGEAALSGDVVSVRFRVRAPEDAPITGVRALVDGRPVSSADADFAPVTRSAEQAGSAAPAYELVVPLPNRDCEISLLARNKNAVSPPATLRIRRMPAPSPVTAPKGKLFVLSVGVGDYPRQGKRMYPARDAADFADTLKAASENSYQGFEARKLIDSEATRDTVLAGLNWLKAATTAQDTAVVLLAGQGAKDEKGVFHFLPHNADAVDPSSVALTASEIAAALRAVPGRIFLFLDTAGSGNQPGGDLTPLVAELRSADTGVVVFSASSRLEEAREDPAWGNGAFMKAVLEGLHGKGDEKIKPGKEAQATLDTLRTSGKITADLLGAYIFARVEELTNRRQQPTTARPQTIPNREILSLKS